MKISIKDIAELHPKKMRCASDHYYVRVANDIMSALKFTQQGKDDRSAMWSIALKLTMYIEDIVSDAGIWGTFATLYARMYNRPLPFYNLPDDFSSADISMESVKFLIWLFMMNEYDGQLLNPDNPGIEDMARTVFPILKRHSQTAPVNEDLLDMLYSDETLNDFMEIKHVLMWLLDACYLSDWMETDDHIDKLIESIEHIMPDASYSLLEYSSRSVCAFVYTGTLLALLPQQWYAEMLRLYNADEFAEVTQEIENIQHKKMNLLRVDGIDDECIRVTDTEGEPLLVRRNSLDKRDTLKIKNPKLLITALAQWKGKWEIIGMSSWSENDSMYYELIEEQQKPSNQQMALPSEILEKLNGRRLFFFKDYTELTTWIKEILHVDSDNPEENDISKATDILVFVEDSGALSIVPDMACGVKSKDNPLYSPKKAPDEALKLLFNIEASTPSMSRYLMKNGLLPDACLNSLISPERGRQLVQENMDFLARCIRRCSY